MEINFQDKHHHKTESSDPQGKPRSNKNGKMENFSVHDDLQASGTTVSEG